MGGLGPEIGRSRGTSHPAEMGGPDPETNLVRAKGLNPKTSLMSKIAKTEGHGPGPGRLFLNQLKKRLNKRK